MGLLFVAQKASWNPAGVEPVDWNQVDMENNLVGRYKVAKTHRIPYLHRSFSAKVTCI